MPTTIKRTLLAVPVKLAFHAFRLTDHVINLLLPGRVFRLTGILYDLASGHRTKVTLHSGRTIEFSTPNALTAWRVETLLDKEPETISWIDSFEPSSVFWDVGANMGGYTIYACATHESLRAYAFEPASSNVGLLMQNIVINDVADRATAVLVALSDSTGIGALLEQDFAPGTALNVVDTEQESLTSDNQGGIYDVLRFSIDDFRERFALACPNYLKIDVDGTESSILAGAARTLEDLSVRSILIEIDERDGGMQRTCGVLEESGFALKEKHRCDAPEETRIYNCIFERS